MQGTILGLTSTVQTVLLVLLAGGLLLIAVQLGLHNPVLLRLGLSNTLRRPTQTLTMIVGLVLSTALITTFFGLPDSFRSSITTDRMAKLGTINETVTGPFTQDQLTHAQTSLGQMSQVRATASIYIHGATVVSERTHISLANQPFSSLYLLAVPPVFDQVHGAIIDNQGHIQHIANLRPGEVLISNSLAQRFDVRVGDHLQVKQDGLVGTIPATVHGVLSNDLLLTSAELATDASLPEVIFPGITIQQVFEQRYHLPFVANMLCVQNADSHGTNVHGTDGSSTPAVLHALQSLFGVAPLDTADPTLTYHATNFDSITIHPLNPGVVGFQGAVGFGGNASMVPVISNKWQLITSPAARQLHLLLPAFSYLLVGAGLLLQVLLCLLLASERRAELGMCRAIGLQRRHIVYALTIEGCGYAILAAVFGVLSGIGVLGIELVFLAQTPTLVDPNVALQAGHIPLHLSISWQSILSAGSISILATTVVIGLCSSWIGRTSIVAALRNLDEPPSVRVSLQRLLLSLRPQLFDVTGHPIPETPERYHARLLEGIGQLLWELLARGFLFLISGFLLFEIGIVHGDGNGSMPLFSLALFIVGGGLFVNWTLPYCNVAPALAKRLSFSLIGLGWLALGLQSGMEFFIEVFAPTASELGSGMLVELPVAQILLLTLLPLIGLVMLVISNADVIVGLLSLGIRNIHGWAAIARTSLVYPLTFRFRTGVTVLLLGLITFLVQLLVINNLNTIQQTQPSLTSGNFQMELTMPNSQVNQALETRLISTKTALPRDISAVSQMLFMNSTTNTATPVTLALPDHPDYTAPAPLTVADDTYLSLTTMPMYIRAEGYRTDRQVWNAVRDHSNAVVLQYKEGLGLPTTNGFSPFKVDVQTENATVHQLTVIGIVPANTHWQTVFLSQRTAAEIVSHPVGPLSYYFRLQPGISVEHAINDLYSTLPLSEYAVSFNSLEESDRNTYTASLTAFLSSYLALGLLFGACSIGVISSRAVVERRQQIGMLRALGFSRALVRRLFLLEASFIITLGLLVGTVMAWWLYALVARVVSLNMAIPFVPIALLLVGSYLVAFVCTILPTWQASRIPPAEALRYE